MYLFATSPQLLIITIVTHCNAENFALRDLSCPCSTITRCLGSFWKVAAKIREINGCPDSLFKCSAPFISSRNGEDQKEELNISDRHVLFVLLYWNRLRSEVVMSPIMSLALWRKRCLARTVHLWSHSSTQRFRCTPVSRRNFFTSSEKSDHRQLLKTWREAFALSIRPHEPAS